MNAGLLKPSGAWCAGTLSMWVDFRGVVSVFDGRVAVPWKHRGVRTGRDVCGQSAGKQSDKTIVTTLIDDLHRQRLMQKEA